MTLFSMKIPLIALLLAITIFISGCVKYEKYEVTAEDVLKEALEKYNSTSYEVTIVSYIVSEDKSFENYQKRVGHGIFKGSKFKIVGKERTVVSNGSVMWIYWNVTKHLIINDFSKSNEKPKEGFTKLFLDLLNNYDLKLKITPNYYIINGTSKVKYYPIKSKTVWIDKKTLMPLKVESKYDLNKLNLTYVTEYKNLKFRKFNDSIFNVTPPKAQEFMRSFYFQKIRDARKRVNFTIIKPSYTAGCKFKGVGVIEQSNTSSVVLYYLHQKHQERQRQEECVLIIFESPT